MVTDIDSAILTFAVVSVAGLFVWGIVRLIDGFYDNISRIELLLSDHEERLNKIDKN